MLDVHYFYKDPLDISHDTAHLYEHWLLLCWNAFAEENTKVEASNERLQKYPRVDQGDDITAALMIFK